MKIKVLGINGSPRRRGNTRIMLDEALRAASELKDVETEYISLAEHKILGGCTACFVCHRKPSLEDLCRGYKEPDDVNMILRKMLDAHGWLIGSPVYFGGVTAQLKSLIDRTHPAQPCGRAFRNKVCGVVTMAYARMGGSEATIDDIHHWLMNLDAIIVGLGPARTAQGDSSYWGASGCQGWPLPLPSTAKGALEGVKQDQIGLISARTLGKRVAELAKAVKTGFGSLEEGETVWGYGRIIEAANSKYRKYK
jgi:multimeric flavodoxin WrbA